MTAEFERLFDQARPAFGQERTFARAKTLAMSALVGLEVWPKTPKRGEI